MFRKCFLNVTLSDSEDPQLIESMSFINISISSHDDSIDNILSHECINQSVVEGDAGIKIHI